MALVMSQFHEPHPRGNHSLVLLKQPPAVVESYSDCATLFLCYFDKFLIFLKLYDFSIVLIYGDQIISRLHY